MQEGEWKYASAQGKYEGSKQTMSNGKSNRLKRMAIAAVCVGMVGSGGLVQAMNTAKPVKPAVKPLKTGTVTSAMTSMMYVPASQIATMPLGESDKITSVNLPDFEIGEQAVTGALWSHVYNWAITKGYTFANTGDNAGTERPVTSVSWNDVIVWTNAYSEKSGFDPVYRGKENKILKNAKDPQALNRESILLSNKKGKMGYRLPDTKEWELVARSLSLEKTLFTKELVKKPKSTIGKGGKKYYWTPAGVRVYHSFEWQFTQLYVGSRERIFRGYTVSNVYGLAPEGFSMSVSFRLARTVK